MLSAAIFCVLFRVNLPLALFTTLYSNPLTILPLYVLAFGMGKLVLGGEADFTAPPELGNIGLSNWIPAVIDWMAGLGKPLALGLVLLAFTLSVLSYVTVRWSWRIWLIRQWRARQAANRRQ